MVLLPAITATLTKGEFAMSEKRHTTTSDQLQPSFDFKAMHNGVQCIASMNPDDVGTERQFWFTIAMLCTIYDVARKTLEDNIKSLVDDGEFVSADFRQYATILDLSGVPHKTAIYNLEVLNKLGMCCFRGNKKAKEIRKAFNDVLVKHETNQNQIALPQTYIEALEALLESKKSEEKTRLALVAEQEHVKEIQAGFEIVESRIQKEVFKQNAKAFSDLGVERKKTKRLESENTTLKTENEELKANLTEKSDQADFLKKKNAEQDQYIPIRYKVAYWVRNFNHEPSWRDLLRYSDACHEPAIERDMPITLHGGIKTNKPVKHYHIRAWKLYEQYEWAHLAIDRPLLPSL